MKVYPRHQRQILPLSHVLRAAAAVAHASTLRNTPAAATVDPDEVRRSSEGTKLLQNRRLQSANLRPQPPPASSFRELNQQLDSARKRNRALVKRLHAAVGFQTRSGESRKERNKKSPGGFGVEHPPRLRRTLALADVSTFLSRSLASVGHMGAPICPSASPKASRHLTEARNKVEEVLLPYNWTLRGSSHSLQNRFPERRRRVCVLRARARMCVSSHFKAFSYI